MPGRPPLHPGIPKRINPNTGQKEIIDVKRGVAINRLVKLPSGHIVKKIWDPVIYNKPVRAPARHGPAAAPLSPRPQPPPPPSPVYKGSAPNANDMSPPIEGRKWEGGTRNKRRRMKQRYTKKRSRL